MINNSTNHQVSLLPYVAYFSLSYLLLSLLLGFIGVRTGSIFPCSLLGAMISSHIFFKKNSRLLNNTEQLKIAFFSLLIILVVSLAIIYLFLPMQATMMLSAFKQPMFVGILFGVLLMLFAGNYFGLKLYNFLLRKDKKYKIDEHGNLEN